ncbi:seipin-like isoform X2 [Patiria miniata]|uniref:Seipin n=1 Tax=Patiria miniata TaxID=46514 RepID=A0A914BGX0_PATMI|nr:seipin-like isoform X1 [Patiria miniata]XP_038075135.1 seipin-like isoform X2 [Patiria miniata]
MSSMLRTKANQLVQTVQGGTDRWVSWLKSTAFRVIAILVLVTLQLWLSIFLYGSFYYAYMPTVSHINPVYLQFSSCKEFGPQPNCPFPSVNSTLQKNPEMGSLLRRGQKYRVLLELEMPQSPVNENQGVFMVRMDIYAADGEITASSSRPAMMHYQSNLLKTIQTLFYIPLLLTGYSEEKQTITVSLMENFIDNPYKPLLGAHIELQARKLEIYSSVLKIQAYFSGLRYLMFQWPISTALVHISVFFFFLSLITVVSWQQCAGAFSSQEEETVVRLEDVYTLSYEDRRKMIRKSMASERAALLRGRPKNVSVISQRGFQDDRDSQSSGISSVDGLSTGDQRSSIADATKASNGEGSSDGGWERVDSNGAGELHNEASSTQGEAGLPENEIENDAGEEVDDDTGEEEEEEPAARDLEGVESGEVSEIVAEGVGGPLVPDGEELRQRKKEKDPDNNYL